jgi:hypothetical protein
MFVWAGVREKGGSGRESVVVEEIVALELHVGNLEMGRKGVQGTGGKRQRRQSWYRREGGRRVGVWKRRCCDEREGGV